MKTQSGLRIPEPTEVPGYLRSLDAPEWPPATDPARVSLAHDATRAAPPLLSNRLFSLSFIARNFFCAPLLGYSTPGFE